MRLARTLATFILVASASSIQAAEPSAAQVGWDITLDRGPVLGVVVIGTESSVRLTATVIVKDRATGEMISAREESDLVWGTTDLTVSNGTERMRLRIFVDFAKDGQAIPVELKIGEITQRALWDPPACPSSAKAKSRLRAAVAELPLSMLMGLKNLYALSFDENPYLQTTGAGLDILFEAGLPMTSIASKRPLKPEEVEALVRESSK